MVTLGMSEDERSSMMRTVAGILHFGNIEVKQRPREEWANIPTTTGQPAVVVVALCMYIWGGRGI